MRAVRGGHHPQVDIAPAAEVEQMLQLSAHRLPATDRPVEHRFLQYQRVAQRLVHGQNPLPLKPELDPPLYPVLIGPALGVADDRLRIGGRLRQAVDQHVLVHVQPVRPRLQPRQVDEVLGDVLSVGVPPAFSPDLLAQVEQLGPGLLLLYPVEGQQCVDVRPPDRILAGLVAAHRGPVPLQELSGLHDRDSRRLAKRTKLLPEPAGTQTRPRPFRSSRSRHATAPYPRQPGKILIHIAI